MKKIALALALAAFGAAFCAAQSVSFGLGDSGLEVSLNEITVSAKADKAAFVADVNLTWGLTGAQVDASLKLGLQPGEIYLAASLAKLSHTPYETVVAEYRKNKAQGWGAVAKKLGIKPGSKEFKSLKDGASKSAAKGKGKKK